MNFEKKRRALITGASTGIGKATALAFAKAGIDVALVSRSQDKLESVAKAAQEFGVEAEAFCMDLAEVSQVKSKIQGISDEFGNIDILINNAGIGYTGPPAITVTSGITSTTGLVGGSGYVQATTQITI